MLIFAGMSNAGNSLIRKAMIFSAGLGTRYKPWTDNHPKALAPVNGKSLLQRNIEYLQGFGITELVINIHHLADQVIDTLQTHNGWGSSYTLSDETALLLETGGGLMKARPLLEEGPFVAMNVDILTDLDLGAMIRDHFSGRPLATLAVTSRSTSRYFLFDDSRRLRGWRNVQTGQERMAGDDVGSALLQQKAFSGVHLIEPAFFGLVRQTGKFSMVDAYLDLAGQHIIRGFDHSGGKLIDVGKPEAGEKAAAMFP
jgi:NDP-sugar pyrophosphorylase family protein